MLMFGSGIDFEVCLRPGSWCRFFNRTAPVPHVH